jgi:hypothetical protein
LPRSDAALRIGNQQDLLQCAAQVRWQFLGIERRQADTMRRGWGRLTLAWGCLPGWVRNPLTIRPLQANVPAANQEETDCVMDERDRIVRRDPRSSYTSHFALMDQVHIDGDTSLRGYVTALCWRSEDGPTIEVSWMHNGQAHSAWFQPSRLVLVNDN